ncbi:Na+/melibiose symporter-like transporter [Kineosphaera limosa]|uniref:Uncharacterized protein n=1 Tax=Kineosphaera limosa NBRC 100340 TaxID=1184609 RepID=K6WFK0_9MICO|nr:hypothetical protein [Kineosphaera limosa]NYE00136.1 Na+/melibiose symporter-like transporter [Kineosphaera limosa]GAB98075.1 hypothetical protein KILIM_098_00140 [Kineosphaera limosa NBRC 100340]
MAITLSTHCARQHVRPAARALAGPPARRSRLQQVRRLLVPVAVLLYLVALPGIILVGADGAAHAFAILAAVAATISLIGIGCAERTRVSRW